MNRKLIYIFFPLIFIQFTCENENQIGGIKTLVKEQQSLSDSSDINDTSIVLVYFPQACMCPQWIDSLEFFRSYRQSNNSYENLDYYNYGYYLGKLENELPENIHFFGNMIQVEGKVELFKDTIWFKDSPTTNIIHASNYEMIRPYNELSHIYKGIDQFGDSIMEPQVKVIR